MIITYRYPVQIKKNIDTGVDESLIIPDLDNTEINLLDPMVQSSIRALRSRSRFVALYIKDILDSKDENDEDIATPKPLEYYESASYEIYLATSLDTAIQPKKIAGKAILFVGTDLERTAYFVEDKKFVKNPETKQPMVATLTLNETSAETLDPSSHRKDEPVNFTLNNSIIIDPLVKEACSQTNRPPYESTDDWFEVSVRHNAKRRCHGCETYLPTFTQLALCIEWISMIVMAAGTLKIAEKEIYPSYDNTTANYQTLASATLNSSVMLYTILKGPGGENQGSLGRSIDTLFHKAHRAITCNSRIQTAAEMEENYNNSSSGMSTFLQGVLTVIALHFIVTSGGVDFVQNVLVADNIEDVNALFPTLVYAVASKINFVANQITDPLIMLGYLLFACGEVHDWFMRDRPKKATAKVEHVPDSAASLAITVHNSFEDTEIAAATKDSLHEKLLEGVTRLNCGATSPAFYRPRQLTPIQSSAKSPSAESAPTWARKGTPAATR